MLRPDPFLLDEEREALGRGERAAVPLAAPAPPRRSRQLSLFDDNAEATPAAAPGPSSRRGALLPTTQDRLVQERQRFHRALGQATERLILSYPRADPRTRPRAPAVAVLRRRRLRAGRPAARRDGAQAGWARTTSTDLDLDDALDASERDRVRAQRGGSEAVLAIAAGSPFFKGSHLAARARWSRRLTPYDGLVRPRCRRDRARRLDPATAPWPVSASSLATYARCGFLYLLRNVLGLEPVRGARGAAAAGPPRARPASSTRSRERFLRERRDARPPAGARRRAGARAAPRAGATSALDALVAGDPAPLTVSVGAASWRTFEEPAPALAGRARRSSADRWTPAHFEVPLRHRARAQRAGEPHRRAAAGRSTSATGRACACRARSTASTAGPTARWCCATTRPGRAPARRRRASSAAAGSSRSRSTCWPPRMLFPEQPRGRGLPRLRGRRAPASPSTPTDVTGDEFRKLLRDLAG